MRFLVTFYHRFFTSGNSNFAMRLTIVESLSNSNKIIQSLVSFVINLYNSKYPFFGSLGIRIIESLLYNLNANRPYQMASIYLVH